MVDASKAINLTKVAQQYKERKKKRVRYMDSILKFWLFTSGTFYFFVASVKPRKGTKMAEEEEKCDWVGDTVCDDVLTLCESIQDTFCTA